MSEFVPDWLRRLGLAQYIEAFKAADIEAETLPSLDGDDLKELGVSLGHRKKILKAIAEDDSPGSTDNPSMSDTQTSAMASERRQVTVVFCDLCGSSSLSEVLDPEDMQDVLNAYYAVCADVAKKYHGHVANFLGDGVVIYFGFPEAREDAALCAVLSAVEICASVAALSGKNALHGKRLEARVGVCTGLVVVGNMGEGTGHTQLDVTGEVPVIAARIQERARPGGVILTKSTHDLVADQVVVEALGQTRIKGLTAPVTLFEVGSVISELQTEDVERVGSTRTSRRNTTPIVGRHRELEQLAQLTATAQAGVGQIVQVVGEPGIGKSRLLQEFHAQTKTLDCLKLQFNCTSLHSNSAFFPIRSILDRLDQHGPSAESDERRILSKSAKRVAALLGPKDEPPVSGLRERHEIIESLWRVIENIVRQRPAIFILEDAHWADPSTLELMNVVARRIREIRAVFVVSHRPDFESSWCKLDHVEHISLSRLPPRGTAQLIAGLAQGRHVPMRVIDLIAVKSDGIPLFAEELFFTLIDSKQLIASAEAWSLEAEVSELSVPATLQDSLMMRLDRLGTAKELAQVGALVGRTFSARIATRLTGDTDESFDAKAARLCASGLVVEHAIDGQRVFEFRHALIQAAARDNLLRSKLRDLHRRIADILKEFRSEGRSVTEEELGYHLAEAGETHAAIHHYRRAGDDALRTSAVSEAIAHYRTASALTDGLLPDIASKKLKLELLTALRNAVVVAHGYAALEVEALCQKSVDLCSEIGADDEMFRVIWNLAGYHMVRAEHLKSVPHNKRLIDIARASGFETQQIMAFDTAAQTQFYMAEHDEADKNFNLTLTLYDEKRHARLCETFAEEDPAVASLCYLALIAWIRDDTTQAEALFQRARDLAGRLPFDHSRALALSMHCEYLILSGQVSGTRETCKQLLRLCVDNDIAYYEGSAQAMMAWVEALNGKAEAGLATMDQVHEAVMSQGVRCEHSLFAALRADILAMLGNFEQAQVVLDADLRLINDTGETWFAPEILRLKGTLALRSGAKPGVAAGWFRKSMALARRQGAWRLEQRAVLGLSALEPNVTEFAGAPPSPASVLDAGKNEREDGQWGAYPRSKVSILNPN